MRRDPRYQRAAYDFVREALRGKLLSLGEERHLTARELLESIREIARDSFGPLARTVFEHWGVHSTDDFGQIVFNLIDEDDMGKTDDDHISDFSAVYDFDEAFPADAGPVKVQRAPDDDEDDDE
jgi:uncharacterized repeat protein (TIGR04138 family)